MHRDWWIIIMLDRNSRESPWMSRYPTFCRGREMLSLVCYDLRDMSSFCGCALKDSVLAGYDALSLPFLLPNFRKHLLSKCPRRTESVSSCQQFTKWHKLYAIADQASDIVVTKSEILFLVSSRMQDRTWRQARPAYCFPSTGHVKITDDHLRRSFRQCRKFRLFLMDYTAATFVTAAA
jgi:hypothetical protein